MKPAQIDSAGKPRMDHGQIWQALVLMALAIVAAGCEPSPNRVDSSPSGRQLAVDWVEGDRQGIVLVNADGTGHRWLGGGEDGTWPAWSPDGRWIAYRVTRTEGDGVARSHLYLYDLASRTPRRLPFDLTPPILWREDGHRLAAIRQVGDKKPVLVRFTLAGTILSEVPLPFSWVEREIALWVPGSDDVLLVGSEASTPETMASNLYRVGIGEVQAITRTGDVIGAGTSRDGRRILWARTASGEEDPLYLYVHDRIAGTARRIPFAARPTGVRAAAGYTLRTAGLATFSPDARQIAWVVLFARPTPAGTPRPGYLACYVSRLDGTDLRLLRYFETVDGSCVPYWTRDGRRLVLLEGNGKGHTLAVYDAERWERRVLLKSPRSN